MNTLNFLTLALVPNFSPSQDAGDLRIATFTDTSTGSDGTITGRLIYLRKYNGSYLVPEGVTTSFISWPWVSGAGDDVYIDVLDKDYCLDVTVLWFAGSTIAYTKTILCLFTGYGDVFLRNLTEALAANRKQIGNNNFTINKHRLRVFLDDAAQGVSLLNDQTIAQFCLDEAKKLTDNISTFF